MESFYRDYIYDLRYFREDELFDSNNEKFDIVALGNSHAARAYDFDSVDLADKYVDIFKIGSGDITWTEILEYTAMKQKPVILATGAANLEDVNRAMKALEKHTEDIVLMQCNTNYTVDPDKFKFINLNVLKTFQKHFPNSVLGLSDHTFGHATVLGAIALGATVFEKHFTDDNDREGPDHKFAMNPTTWREMVDNANQLYSAMGDGVKRIEANEQNSIIVQQRCLRATRYLEAGETITKSDLEALRPIPADGLQPYKIEELVGKTLKKYLQKGNHITLEHI
jgi:N-acetylneuraminate synthase